MNGSSVTQKYGLLIEVAHEFSELSYNTCNQNLNRFKKKKHFGINQALKVLRNAMFMLDSNGLPAKYESDGCTNLPPFKLVRPQTLFVTVVNFSSEDLLCPTCL